MQLSSTASLEGQDKELEHRLGEKVVQQGCRYHCNDVLCKSQSRGFLAQLQLLGWQCR